jgi:hypothetical protein
MSQPPDGRHHPCRDAASRPPLPTVTITSVQDLAMVKQGISR